MKLRWYIPPGVTPPAHLRPGLMPIRLRDGVGPDRQGGLVLGGLYDPASVPRWKKTTAGWWFLPPAEAVTTADLEAYLRLRGEPYTLVACEGIAWRVPRLLDPSLTLLPHLITHVGALDAQGQPVLISVARCEALAGRVADFFRRVPLVPEYDVEHPTPEHKAANNLAVVQLACDIVGQSYHLSAFELFGLGLATWAWADLVLTAAASLTPEAPPRV